MTATNKRCVGDIELLIASKQIGNTERFGPRVRGPSSTVTELAQNKSKRSVFLHHLLAMRSSISPTHF